MKALARQGVARVPGGWATPCSRILDWLGLLMPSLLLIAEMLQPVLVVSVSFRS